MVSSTRAKEILGYDLDFLSNCDNFINCIHPADYDQEQLVSARKTCESCFYKV